MNIVALFTNFKGFDQNIVVYLLNVQPNNNNNNDENSSLLENVASYELLKGKYIFVIAIFSVTIVPFFQTIYQTIQQQYIANSNKTKDKKYHAIDFRFKRVSVFSSLFSYLILVMSFIVWIILSPSQLLQSNPILILTLYGTINAFIVNRFIVGRVCDQEVPTFMNILISLLLLLVHSIYSQIFDQSILNEWIFTWCYLLIVIGIYIHFLNGVIDSIRSYNDILCFYCKEKNE